MAVQVKLLVGPEPSALRRRLIDEFRRRSSKHAGGAVWVGPTPESIDDVRMKLAIAAGAVVAPRLYDWDGLAAHILRRLDPRRKAISTVRRRLLLQQVVGELKRRKQFEYFDGIAESPGFADSAAGMLDELADSGIDSRQLINLMTEDDGADARARKRRDLAALVRTYLALIDDRQCFDPDDVVRVAVERLQSASSIPLELDGLFVECEPELPPHRLALLRLLAKKVQRLTISLPDVEGDPRVELFRLARRTRETIEKNFANVEVIQVDLDGAAPAGLRHLRQRLFTGPRAGPPSSDAAGISLIEAPGALGEARLVARRIRLLLSENVRAERILVVMRKLARTGDLLAEVFDEYRVPFDIEVDSPLWRNPFVSTLLNAARLCEDNWPFEAVTALLRNTLVQPAWPGFAGDADSASHAEALLRMLGAPRGREAVLRAVSVWAENPPEPLEDEDVEEPRRLRKAKLAGRVRPFLQQFLKLWDCFPLNGAPTRFAEALRQFAAAFSLTAEALHDEPAAQAALAEFFHHVETWANSAAVKSLPRGGFFRVLHTIAAAPASASRVAPGRVRVRNAESAAHLEADYLFILRLEEKEFPDLSPPRSLLDDADRHLFRERGIPFPEAHDRLSREMAGFYQLVALPSKELILSRPAVDPKGQPLLPSSFMRSVQSCFAPNAITAQRQRMLIEDYYQREPIAEAELRVRFAADAAERPADSVQWAHPLLPARLTDNLRDAARMAAARFHGKEFGEFDGLLSAPKILEQLRERFGNKKTFSPTALEAYVACPFRFYLDSVLRLEELDEPVEEVEATRRGSAFHRALARFHRGLRDAGPIADTLEDLGPAVSEKLTHDLNLAINEYLGRSSSDAARVLWELEGKRLKRFSARYHEHWERFVEPWRARAILPAPTHLEVDFGMSRSEPDQTNLDPVHDALTIRIDDIEVRILGRIDRVDVAELENEVGFWIVDYKTGRAGNYTGPDLTTFRKLQLSLYALAVERVILKDRQARPLGLAYWLVTDSGFKLVLPDYRGPLKWLADPSSWREFRGRLEDWVVKIVSNIRAGRFPLAPRSDDCTQTCPYGQVCRISQSRSTGKVFDLPLPGAGTSGSQPSGDSADACDPAD